jgi:hypothetical protein
MSCKVSLSRENFPKLITFKVMAVSRTMHEMLYFTVSLISLPLKICLKISAIEIAKKGSVGKNCVKKQVKMKNFHHKTLVF